MTLDFVAVKRAAVVAAAMCALIGAQACGPKPDATPKTADTAAAAPPPGMTAPDSFLVSLKTSKGPVTIKIHRDWSPNGADRFYELVKTGFFTDARFFRVVPDFVVQFGMPADPKVGLKWMARDIKDEPVKGSNKRGVVTFARAGPNTRSTQLFINLKDNPGLDTDSGFGFPPIGTVTEGMANVDKFNSEYGENPDQGMITSQGNAYLNAQFPKLDFIQTADVTQEWKAGAP